MATNVCKQILIVSRVFMTTGTAPLCLAQINAKASLTIKNPMVDNIAELTSAGVGDLRAGIVLM